MKNHHPYQLIPWFKHTLKYFFIQGFAKKETNKKILHARPKDLIGAKHLAK